MLTLAQIYWNKITFHLLTLHNTYSEFLNIFNNCEHYLKFVKIPYISFHFITVVNIFLFTDILQNLLTLVNMDLDLLTFASIGCRLIIFWHLLSKATAQSGLDLPLKIILVSLAGAWAGLGKRWLPIEENH